MGANMIKDEATYHCAVDTHEDGTVSLHVVITGIDESEAVAMSDLMYATLEANNSAPTLH